MSFAGRFRRWLPVLVVAAAIFVGSSIPGSALPRADLWPGLDKLVHLTEYAVFGALVARALAQRGGTILADSSRVRRYLRLILGAAVAALMYGASDEFHQWFVPRRSVDARDLLADVTGGAVGGAAFVLLADRRQRLRRNPKR